ncbi:DUF1642 domain-containing protein [Listeria monocytogenes]|nr:DUF1642 domain-containing protein [Listeria monocytogenes]EAF3084599.1 DUF1642 domain-containing protein [Listeria monocytogenes]EAF4331083.1 DUF1642 domain-containing protein [Listeria monocytogenes]
MKFEVGERVQFFYDGTAMGLGIIIEMDGNTCIVESEGNQGSYFIAKSEIAKLDQPEPQSEKVKKINEIMLELINRKHMDILSDDDITRMLIEALDIVNTLDQPAPVVVPKFVAECIREYELVLSDGYSTKDTVLDNIIQDWALGGIDSDFSDWVDDNLITLIDAVLNGYVVEEEKKYYVKIVYTAGGFLNLQTERDGSFCYRLRGASEPEGYKTKFTETEIKAIDERLWTFAVPVEEVEASE